MQELSCDVVIVGSGVAGLVCALNIPRKNSVILITKKELEDSNSYLAQGGISIRRGIEDRKNFIEDTLKAGHYKNTLETVEILVDESEEALDFLIDSGVDFTRDKGEIAYTKEGGHDKFRIAYSEDATGKAIMDALIKKVVKRENIKIITNCEMQDLLVSNNKCYGIYAKTENEKLIIKSKNTVLATGGIGGIYKNSTNFSHIRGDGVALAIKHGVELKDISYVQIHPTTLYENKKGRRFLISESVRGEGAILLNHKEERFTEELKPRDIVSKSILDEMKKENVEYEYLNMRTIDLDIEKRFPNICKYLKDININPKEENVPVVPSQHYTMGGIKVDKDSKTTMKNLFAVGEVACTGVHGKNRLASNSLLESVVFGKRAAIAIINKKEEDSKVNENLKYEDLINYEDLCNLIKKRIVEDEFKKIEELSNR